jgi:hypothetical protein
MRGILWVVLVVILAVWLVGFLLDSGGTSIDTLLAVATILLCCSLITRRPSGRNWPSFAMLVLFSATTASAQTAATVRPDLGNLLTPGMTVWITDSSGQEQRARIVGVTGDAVTTSADGVSRRLTTNDIRRVEVRESDSLLNGALIGAGVAIASGLFLCTRGEPWENCRDDVGPMLRIGAIGAGAGIGIDALIRGRRTIYGADDGASVRVAPVLGRDVRALQLSVRF